MKQRLDIGRSQFEFAGIDAEDLILPTYANHFDSMTLQPGRNITIVRLESANPAVVANLIGEYYATGSLIVRTVKPL